MNGQQPVGRQAAPRFLETTIDLEKKFLRGRQNQAEELESAVRHFLEFLMGFESLTLMQTRVIEQFPMVLMDKTFWARLRAFMEESPLAEATIDPEDLGAVPHD